MSTTTAGLAVKLGYTDVKVLLAGVPGWKKSGHYVVASKSFIKKGNIVLVDLRSKNEFESGHIPRAHNIPLVDLEYAEDSFPPSKVAPIVLYGNGADAKKAYKIVKGWGRKKGSVASVDFAAWKKGGNPVETGASPGKIVWKRKLGKNEISIAEFMKDTGGAAGKLILDVRNADEAASGKLPTSINISLDEIQSKLNTLPKDKEILVHCTTGARAEMASTELRNAGFKSRYLVANVECDGPECDVYE